MFGFSLQKLLVLAGIIAAVWYGFKLVGRLDAARRAQEGQPAAKQGGFTDNLRRWSGRRSAPRSGPAEAEDMVRCEVCSAYVAARGATSCGRGDCPY